VDPAPARDRYRIIAPLGKGGMGEVFRARDTRLERDVAVKVLPADVANDPDRLRRLETEARAAGQINHPNVLAVYDVATVNGNTCIISELLDGETLGQRLARGKLAPSEVIRYATQIAEGLAAAHRRAIVHRDLKPDNIFITVDDRPKILDFGLAKSLQHPETDAETTVRATAPGAVLGTVGYMSPEQVRGGPVDQRSDIFSFGVVLFEMLTARRAFRRSSAAETYAAILNEEPQQQPDDGISQELVGILRRCLAKNPDTRYQSAGDLAFHLGQLASAPAVSRAGTRKVIAGAATATVLLLIGAGFWYSRPKQQPMVASPARTTSLAVLPFVNMSGDRNDEYFSDGMTEEIINALAKVEGLHVAARTSISFPLNANDDVRAAT
jgi:eukaryotic-like serine/threonine-protein kinase